VKQIHRGVFCWQGNSDFQVSAMRIVGSYSQKTGFVVPNNSATKCGAQEVSQPCTFAVVLLPVCQC